MEENSTIQKPQKPRFWSRKKSIALVLLAVSIFGILGFGAFMLNKPKQIETTGVLSSTDGISPTAVTQTPSASPSSKTISPAQTKKTKEITIALFGDSMIDTMGDEVDVLSSVLSRKYPDTKFNFYNYGIGAQNVEAGLARFDSSYVYFKRSYPSVPTLKPDILIIGSFSYNPFNPHNPSRHMEALTSLLTKAKKTGADVYLLVEIAPLTNEFGKGEKGPNMPESQAIAHAARIREHLEDSLTIAQSLQIPVIDAYSGSKTSDTEGTKEYVNRDDGIHPSYEGHLYTADQIVKTVKID